MRHSSASPHFGIWIKVFNTKPKVVDSKHAECGGTMVSKLPNITWPQGAFVETVKGWQREWFYVTECECTKVGAFCTPLLVHGHL